MKNIEINTTQNVVIEYKAATLVDRGLAFILDQLILLAIFIVLYFAFSWLFITVPLSEYLLFIPCFYSLIWEMFNNGQSPGKMAMGIRVLKINGEEIGFYDYLMRWVFRLVDVYLSLGTLAALTIASSPRSQRIGDFLADTAVIKINDSGRLSFDRIMQLSNLENHVPTYPEITRLSEEEMLLVKEITIRYYKYPTEGHQKAIAQLIKKIEDELGIRATGDRIEFLNTLIKDYVALTR